MNQDSLKKVFIESFDAYADAIFRFCLVKTSNKEFAEDLTQETFMRYWKQLGKGTEMTNTRSFLYTTANHLVIDWYRKKKSDSLDARIESGLEPPDTQLLPLEIEAEHALILDAMQKLDEDDRNVLLLRYVEGIGPQEIAEILGDEPNRVSVRLTRATKRLQELLHI